MELMDSHFGACPITGSRVAGRASHVRSFTFSRIAPAGTSSLAALGGSNVAADVGNLDLQIELE